jgi:hypothetical protein
MSEPVSLQNALLELEKLARNYSIAAASEVVDYLKKLRDKKPQPVGGSTWSVSAAVSQEMQVSLIMQASPNENGWYVQSYFGPPLK